MDKFIRNITKTGAVSSCTEQVAYALRDTANIEGSSTIVELGAGTGAITEKLLEKIRDDQLFMALEVCEHFVEETKKRCPDAIVYHDSAENIKECLQKHNKDVCECVISTLPWTIFDDALKERILDRVIDVLAPGGEFLTVTYTFAPLLPSGRRFRALLERKFSEVRRTKPVWKNLPPVYVYHCKK